MNMSFIPQNMKASFFIRIFSLIAVCSLSFMSYRYLQAAKGQLPTDTFQQRGGSHSQGDENQVVAQDSNTAQKAEPDEEYQPSALPDVELLKFVIQKSREGIPVLNIDKWIPWK